MTETISGKATTRRNALKLGAAAALAAAGSAALGTTKIHASGGGYALDIFYPPARVVNTIGSAKLTNGTEVVLGPFPLGDGATFSDSYTGFIANLTAARWVSAGWLSVRTNGTAFDPATLVVNYSGTGHYWSNMFFVKFGAPTAATASDGKIIVRCGGGATNFIIDRIGFFT